MFISYVKCFSGSSWNTTSPVSHSGIPPQIHRPPNRDATNQPKVKSYHDDSDVVSSWGLLVMAPLAYPFVKSDPCFSA